MKLKSIVIENFLAIGDATIALADRGLVLVEGVNLVESSADSNGAGKSTIADAISWVNYGVTARGEDADGVVNIDAGKDCRVIEQIEDGDDLYEITRHRKHKTGKNNIWLKKIDPKTGAVIADLTKGTNPLTQVEIEKLIGCSYEVFTGAIYAAQENFPDLPGMTDKTLKMLIEEASGATLLEVAYKEANKRLNEANNLMNAKNSALARGRIAIQDADENLASATANKDSFEIKRAADEKALRDLGRKQKAEVDRLADDLSKMTPSSVLSDVLKELDEKIALVEAELVRDRGNSAKVTTAEREEQRAAAELRSLEANRAAHKREMDDLDHQIGCPCSTCNRPFSAEDIEPAKKLAETKLAKYDTAITDARAKLDAASLAQKNAVSARDAYRASMTDLTATNAERASCSTELTKVNAAEASLNTAKAALNGTLRQLKAKIAETNPFLAEIAKREKTLEDCKAQAVAIEKELDDAIQTFKIAEHVAKVFSPTGVRAFLLDEVTPFLNDQTAKYLGTLTDGHISATWTTLVKNAKGELREKFSIEVENSTGGKTFKSISGGEKRKVRVACALALQDLVARRASKPIEIFIGDEIDGALDVAGQERLIQILEEKAKERGSVFIISHNDLKSWITQTITVEKSGPRSVVKESLS